MRIAQRSPPATTAGAETTMADLSQTQLEAMGLKDLQAAFETATGKPTKAPNKKYLIKAILEAQANSAAPDVGPQSEAQVADAKAAMEAEAKPAEAPAEPTDDSPFAGMSPQQIIETAKAKGRAKVEASKRAKQAEAATTDATDGTPAKAKRSKEQPKRESDGLADMDAAALQALYLKEIGRPTGSDNVGYLIWKIREARKGNIKVGPAAPRAPKSDVPVKVIPIRIEEDALAAMDALVGEGKPYSSRMDIFRKAIAVWADMAGHTELSNLIVGVRSEAAVK